MTAPSRSEIVETRHIASLLPPGMNSLFFTESSGAAAELAVDEGLCAWAAAVATAVSGR